MYKTIHFIFRGSTIHLSDKELLEIKLNYSEKFSVRFVVYSQIDKLETITRRLSEKTTSLISFLQPLHNAELILISLIYVM